MMRVLATVRELYPTFLNGRNEQTTFVLWKNLFDTETYEEMITALHAYVCRDTKGFPPPIGALKELVWQQRNERISEQTAWEMVRKQLNGSSAHPRENFDKLPETVRACVGSPQTLMRWGQMDDGELETVVASNFKRSYRETLTKKREYDVLPATIKARFSETVVALPPVQQETQKLTASSEWKGTTCPPEIKARVQAALRGDRQEDAHAGICD